MGHSKVAIVSRGYGGKLNNKKVNVISDGINLYYNASDDANTIAEDLARYLNRYKMMGVI